MSEEDRTAVVIVGDGSDSARRAAEWAERFARAYGMRSLATPPTATRPMVLDIASKEQAEFLVRELRGQPDAALADVDVEHAALVRRAPCPVWTIQPWAPECPVHFKVAVVGVDPSREARATAHAAKGILLRSAQRSGSRALPRLLLVHGLTDHPAEIAARTRWPEILASMQIERHPWLERLAGELADEHLAVEAIVRPVWAPELIGAAARCAEADFIALGSGWQTETAEVRPPRIMRCVVRATPCPMLTV
jgi:hypothetical protein